MGKKYAEKVQSEQCDPWFEMIGESSTALLLKLYSQVQNLLLFNPIYIVFNVDFVYRFAVITYYLCCYNYHLTER